MGKAKQAEILIRKPLIQEALKDCDNFEFDVF